MERLLGRSIRTGGGVTFLLLIDLYYASSTNGAATLADSETKAVFHSDWLDKNYVHLRVIARQWKMRLQQLGLQVYLRLILIR